MTGFQSPCAEYAETPLSLDARYLKNRSSTFLARASGKSRHFPVQEGDVLVIDRSLPPREGDMVVAVVRDEFLLARLRRQAAGWRLFPGGEALDGSVEAGNFVWGVVTALVLNCR